eukprot:scaffold21033_cov68-Cyclotella_meneghiniana.AAC.10
MAEAGIEAMRCCMGGNYQIHSCCWMVENHCIERNRERSRIVCWLSLYFTAMAWNREYMIPPEQLQLIQAY